MTQSSWNQNSYLNIKLGEQLSLKAFIFLAILVKLYLVKMCPIFASSASNCLARYKQILLGCSLGCKNALKFTCLPMKFHDRVHTTIQPIVPTSMIVVFMIGKDQITNLINLKFLYHILSQGRTSSNEIWKPFVNYI